MSASTPVSSATVSTGAATGAAAAAAAAAVATSASIVGATALPSSASATSLPRAGTSTGRAALPPATTAAQAPQAMDGVGTTRASTVRPTAPPTTTTSVPTTVAMVPGAARTFKTATTTTGRPSPSTNIKRKPTAMHDSFAPMKSNSNRSFARPAPANADDDGGDAYDDDGEVDKSGGEEDEHMASRSTSGGGGGGGGGRTQSGGSSNSSSSRAHTSRDRDHAHATHQVGSGAAKRHRVESSQHTSRRGGHRDHSPEPHHASVVATTAAVTGATAAAGAARRTASRRRRLARHPEDISVDRETAYLTPSVVPIEETTKTKSGEDGGGGGDDKKDAKAAVPPEWSTLSNVIRLHDSSPDEKSGGDDEIHPNAQGGTRAPVASAVVGVGLGRGRIYHCLLRFDLSAYAVSDPLVLPAPWQAFMPPASAAVDSKSASSSAAFPSPQISLLASLKRRFLGDWVGSCKHPNNEQRLVPLDNSQSSELDTHRTLPAGAVGLAFLDPRFPNGHYDKVICFLPSYGPDDMQIRLQAVKGPWLLAELLDLKDSFERTMNQQIAVYVSFQSATSTLVDAIPRCKGELVLL